MKTFFKFMLELLKKTGVMFLLMLLVPVAIILLLLATIFVYVLFALGIVASIVCIFIVFLFLGIPNCLKKARGKKTKKDIFGWDLTQIGE